MNHNSNIKNTTVDKSLEKTMPYTLPKTLCIGIFSYFTLNTLGLHNNNETLDSIISTTTDIINVNQQTIKKESDNQKQRDSNTLNDDSYTRDTIADITMYNSGDLATKEKILQKWNNENSLIASLNHQEKMFLPITYLHPFEGTFTYHTHPLDRSFDYENTITVRLKEKIEAYSKMQPSGFQYKVEIDHDGFFIPLDQSKDTNSSRLEYLRVPDGMSLIILTGDKNPTEFGNILHGLHHFTDDHYGVKLYEGLPKLEEKLIEKGYLVK